MAARADWVGHPEDTLALVKVLKINSNMKVKEIHDLIDDGEFKFVGTYADSQITNKINELRKGNTTPASWNATEKSLENIIKKKSKKTEEKKQKERDGKEVSERLLGKYLIQEDTESVGDGMRLDDDEEFILNDDESDVDLEHLMPATKKRLNDIEIPALTSGISTPKISRHASFQVTVPKEHSRTVKYVQLNWSRKKNSISRFHSLLIQLGQQ
jgi:hypothetical protein